MGAEPESLHPFSGTTAAAIVDSALFAACTRENAQMAWIPEMCESVPTLANGGARWVDAGADHHLEVTFKLRAGWQWHDGQPVTADDYVFTWQMALDPRLQVHNRAAWEEIQEMVAVDAHTLLVRYHSEATLAAAAAGTGDAAGMQEDYTRLRNSLPAGPVAEPFYYALGTPLPRHILGLARSVVEANAAFGTAPVGNGAYRLVSWQPGRGLPIELQANERFVLGVPHIKRLVLSFVPGADSALAWLREDKLDGLAQDGLLDHVSEVDRDLLEKAGFKVYLTPTGQWEHIDLNLDRFPFNDQRVRRALDYATDKATLARQLQTSNLLPADSFLPSTHWAYSSTAIFRRDYSLLKARSLLNDAGWDCQKLPCSRSSDDGQTRTLAFTLLTTDRSDRQQLAQLLARQWSEAGFGVNVKLMYGRSLFLPAAEGGPLASRDFDAAVYAWMLSDDPQVESLYACESIPTRGNGYVGLNYPGWCNQNINGQLLHLSGLPEFLDRETRQSALAGVQAAWTGDLPAIPLFHILAVSVARSDLHGYAPPPGGGADLWNAWQWEIVQ